MDSIDYFDKRKDPKKNNDFLKEWDSLKKNKKTLEKKNKKPMLSSQSNDVKKNQSDV